MNASIPDPRRRRLLLATAAVLPLAACDKAPASFTGIDLTGANYGREFSLKDADGQTRSLAEFKGKAVLIFFGFTQCPDVCPTSLARAAEIKRLLGADAERLQVIFITVDPERDTPEVLKAYAAAFDAGVIGLYGDAAQTQAAAREFKVYYAKVPTGSSYTMDHTALSYVIDPAGQLRLALRHESSAQECAADIRRLLST
ncbi:MAG: SCO family protein [Burkholderiaceae bacterium]